jgi:hypothetical protein
MFHSDVLIDRQIAVSFWLPIVVANEFVQLVAFISKLYINF